MKIEIEFAPIFLKFEKLEEAKKFVTACFSSNDEYLNDIGKQVNAKIPKELAVPPRPHKKDRREVSMQEELLSIFKNNPDKGFLSTDIRKACPTRKLHTVHTALSKLYFEGYVLREKFPGLGKGLRYRYFYKQG
jgi:hypothetical protein